MDEKRKIAYRYLLYWAMLDIRSIQWIGYRGWRAWSPLHCRRESQRVQAAGAVADWLHNLARDSAHDFYGFDEGEFWRDFESFRSRHPEFGLEQYRVGFERHINQTSEPPGRESSGTSDPAIT